MAGVITLALESSTYAGSAALFDGRRILGAHDIVMRGKNDEALMPAIGKLLADNNLCPRLIERVVCGSGPGAFTSLRVAASIAKGISMASGAPLIPVSSMALIVASFPAVTAGRLLAVSDAMRGESYAQFFEYRDSGNLVENGPVFLLPSEAIDETARSEAAIAIGPQQPGERRVSPNAVSVMRLTKLIETTPPADLSGWEPAYGRLAEAQVKWETATGKRLQVS